MSETKNSEVPELSSDSPWGLLGRDVTMGAVAAVGHFIMNTLNETNVINQDALWKAVTERPAGQGLVTVCNHTSTFDDPVLMGSMFPLSHFYTDSQTGHVRFSTCAKDICFTNRLFDAFCRTGKVYPMDRAAGVGQPTVDFMADLVSRGHWVSIFPEGKVNQKQPDQLLPFKWGVGKILCDAAAKTDTLPLVVPYYHRGMEKVKVVKKPYFHTGNKVDVMVGEPIPLDELLKSCQKCKDEGKRRELWIAITGQIQSSMEDLQAKLHQHG